MTVDIWQTRFNTRALWIFFFFSSKRRHTRFKCDWSSDVCSSDLLDIQGLDPVGHAPVRLAMPQTVSGPAKPPPRLRGTAVQPGRRPLPPRLPGGGKNQNAHGVGRAAPPPQPPTPPTAITPPDHLARPSDGPAHG